MTPERGAAREGCGIQITPERGAVYRSLQRGVRYTDHFREGCDIQITPERGAVYR